MAYEKKISGGVFTFWKSNVEHYDYFFSIDFEYDFIFVWVLYKSYTSNSYNIILQTWPWALYVYNIDYKYILGSIQK